MLAVLCRSLERAIGDRLLNPWPWTAHVGQRWDTYDVAPVNLYNVLWRFGQCLFRHAYA